MFKRGTTFSFRNCWCFNFHAMFSCNLYCIISILYFNIILGKVINKMHRLNVVVPLWRLLCAKNCGRWKIRIWLWKLGQNWAHRSQNQPEEIGCYQHFELFVWLTPTRTSQTWPRGYFKYENVSPLRVTV